MTSSSAQAGTGRPIVVGELNPHGANPYYALYHLPRAASGNRLRCIMGLTDIEYDRLLDKVNLCAGEWKLARARTNLIDLLARYPGRVFILLGSKVLQAARRVGPGMQDWEGSLELFDVARAPSIGGAARCTVVFLPHPSSRNRMWNKPGAVSQARKLLAEVVPGISWGSCDCELPVGKEVALVTTVGVPEPPAAGTAEEDVPPASAHSTDLIGEQ